MTVGLALLLGLGVAWGLGAKLSLLAKLDFRGDWLVFASLGIQVALFTNLLPAVSLGVEAALHVLTYVLLLMFLLLNRRIPGFWMVGAGVISNVVVIVANGGYMPVSIEAWRAIGEAPAAITRTGYFHNNVLTTAHTHLSFLGDVFALPTAVPMASALSVGDMLVVLGMVAFVYRTCSPRPARSAGGSSVLAPLRYPDFRRVVAGRLTSKLGDWLTQAAAVTWIYSSTRSTFGVSAFLLVRVVGATLGGVMSAPLLDRMPGFRLLSLVETARGVLAAGMLAAAVTGHVWPVIALSAASAFLGSATAPGASSLIPDVLPPELLQAGNSLHGVARNLMLVVGAFLGGFLVTHFGIGAALTVDIGTFGLAALVYSRFKAVATAEHEPSSAETSRVSHRELLATLLSNRVIFGLTASFTVVTAAMGLLNTSLPKVLDQQLSDPHAYGYALGVLGAGLMCGELLTGFVQRESVARRTVSLAFLSMAGMVVVITHSHVQATLLLMLFMLGASDGTTEIVYDTLFQIYAPRRMLAGVFAIASSVQNVGMMVGLVAAPLVLSRIGVPGAMRLITVGCIAGSAVAAAALVGRRPSPEEDEADTIRRDRRSKWSAALGSPTQTLETPAAVASVALGESVASLAVARAGDGPVTVESLLDGEPLVLASVGRERRGERTAMLSELTERLSELGCRVVSVNETRAEAVMGGTGHGGLWMVDPAGVLRFAFAASGPDEWIPASFVVSRLRRLNGAGSSGRAA